MIAYGVMHKVMPTIFPMFELSRIFFAVIIGLLSFFYYHFLKNGKIQMYVKKYQDEAPEARKKGTVIVLLYTVGIMVLAIITPIILWGIL